MSSQQPTAGDINRKLQRLILLTFVLLLPSLLLAQSFRGSIRGKVVDPSGSLIAGAKVTAKNSATSQLREASTGEDGAYVLAELPAGEYVVVAESTGLSPVAQNVIVNIGSDTTADFDLTRLEKKLEQLTVTEEAPIVDTTRDVLGEVVDRKLVDQLPLNGRDFGKLVALSPGATVDPSGVAGTQGGFGQFNINGNRDRSNNYTLDGTDNNDPFFNNSALNQTGIGGAPASLLPIDAIQEFNLQSQFGAEYGRNSGSVVNIVTRSGTNKLHGSAFEFLRNSALDARNYFNSDPHKSVFQNSNFGASLGGPIVKDKTFFFGAYEGQREQVGSDFLLLVPTQAQIQQARSIAGAINGTPSNPVINPGLDAILAFYPKSDTSQIPGVVRDRNDGDNFIAKIDHNLTNTELLTGRYAFGQSNQIFPFGSPGGFGAGSRLPQFAQTSPARVQVVSVSLLSSLSNSKINDVRFGYSRYRTSFSSLNANFDPNTIGLNLGTGRLGLPEFDFTNIENLGATGFSVPRGRTSQTFQILDNFTWLKGRHTFKFGGEFRRASISNFNDNLERGIYQFTAGIGLSTDPVVDALANFYTGGTQDTTFCCAFVSVDTGNTQRTTYNNGFSFFAQDDYRLGSNITVNLGLRWEYFGPLSEKNNLLSNLGRDGNLAMVGTDGLNGLYNRDLHDFAPRLGFAWQVVKNTVVRAGYGIYYDYVPQDLLIANFTTSAGVATNPIGPKAVLPLAFDATAFNGTNPTPNAPVMNAVASPPYSIFITPRNFHSPYTQNWNLNVQQKLAQNASFEARYVGSKGTKLVRLTDLNEPDANGNRTINPNYSAIDELTPSSSSTYHALQAIARIQNAHHISGFAAYVWSKSIDDASDGIDFVPGAAFPQDPGNLGAERGPSLFDTRHRFTSAINYELPSWNALGRFGSGWQLNTIISVQSGRPIPIANSTDTSGRFYFNQRPNLVPGVNPILSHWTPSTGYLNPLAFVQPAFGTFGDLDRDSIYGPGFSNADFSITKNTRLTERLNVQLRAEFFNIFNHPNFALPAHTIIPGYVDNGSPGSPQVVPNAAAHVNGDITQPLLPMGLITQTPDVAQTNPGLGGGGPRVVQLAAKFTF
ncbi:MAG TPA: carboxypeptidase regulatory-like domain-containing protein [Terriglobales bacterium]|nr:carboxypeptidase regulatory-like domain-containing protein [Terriglobales bacterium]